MKASFKPRARLLQLLGDQLIGTPQLAIFELVKNSYDADADRVEVLISHPDEKEISTIEVTDFGGTGMDIETIKNIWLEPGADHKDVARKAGIRTQKHHRLPLGEKGVGRFAVHKLGKKIKLLTKSKNEKEISLSIDWDVLGASKYIDETEIEITQNEVPEFFKGDLTGTRIIISNLNSALSKKDIRELHRNIQSIKSPFEYKKFKLDNKVSNFDIELKVPDHPEWIEDLVDLNSIINQAIFKFSFIIGDGKWSWQYDFSPTEALKKEFGIEPVSKFGNDEYFETKSFASFYKEHSEDFYKSIGDMLGEIYVFDFDKEVKKFYSSDSTIKKFLEHNKGIRVYRDGIRVYNYGEPSDDWLEMDRSRVQRITEHLNRDITVGAISLSLEETRELIEKTNREGFIENVAFQKLKFILKAAIGKFESLRNIDKDRLRRVTSVEAKSSITAIENPIEDLKEIAKIEGWTEKLSPYISRIERSYNEMRSIMLTAGSAGLNMSVAFHEIHRGIKDTKKIIQTEGDISLVLKQFDRFELLLDTYSELLKKEKNEFVTLKEILKNNIDLASARFVMHDITYSCPIMTGEQPDYIVRAPKAHMTSAINNVIDNSIYWLDQKFGLDQKKKYIYIGISEEFDKGPAIIIADNGPGWRNISPEEIVKPFLTTKPGGMGIGMYFADTIMQMIGGELLILNHDQVELPIPADGAVVALVFNGGEPCKK